MKATKFFTAIICASSISLANANLSYERPVDYKDVKYQINQCISSGERFSIVGWFLSGKENIPGNIKVYLNNDGLTKEIPIIRSVRSDVSEEFKHPASTTSGFNGSINLPNMHNSSSHERLIVDTQAGQPVETHYSCNSTTNKAI